MITDLFMMSAGCNTFILESYIIFVQVCKLVLLLQIRTEERESMRKLLSATDIMMVLLEMLVRLYQIPVDFFYSNQIVIIV